MYQFYFKLLKAKKIDEQINYAIESGINSTNCMSPLFRLNFVNMLQRTFAPLKNGQRTKL